MDKKEEDQVSIIIPIYNEEDKIIRNIESVLNSDYENIQIILVNDNSSDNTIKILNRYILEEERIVLINNEKNMGAAFSRNIALDKATGKYVIFLDADDWIEPDFVSTLVQNANKDNLDIVQINYIKEEKDQSIPQKHFKVKKEIYSGKEDILENIKAVISNNKLEDSYFSHIRSISGKIFKRSLIEKKEKIRFKEDLVLSENIFFNLEYMLRAKKIKYIQKYLIHFTKDKSSITNSYIEEEKIKKEVKRSIKYMKESIRDVKTIYKLEKKEKATLDEYLSLFIFERIFLVYKHSINLKKDIEEKDKKRELIKYIESENYIKYIKNINKNKLTDLEKKFLKYIKSSMFLRRFRII